MDIEKSNKTSREYHKGKHRFEHWYRDNQVYFVTARCRDKFPALESEQAKQIFWTKFEHCSDQFNFEPWIVSLLNNHYHAVGYVSKREEFAKFMQRFHGAVAKLVNDLLEVRLVPFFIDSGRQNYFDGCLRDIKQLTRAYRYTLGQGVRHRLCPVGAVYPHTRVYLDVESCVKHAVERNALLLGVPYARYLKKGNRS